MEVNIKSIHFDATESLKDFIIKKVNRLARHYENITTVEVTLNVVKPETSMNKEAGILISVPPREGLLIFYLDYVKCISSWLPVS